MNRAETKLDELIDSAGERFEPGRRALFHDFAHCVLRNIETHLTGGEPALATVAREAFEWAVQREPGEIALRVRQPADRPGHTVIELYQDDCPFIVDSVRMVLRQFGLQERLFLHPILRVERDAEGTITKVRANGNADIETRESYVYVEVVPRVETQAHVSELERVLRQTMTWVAEVTGDHRRMVLVMRELMANLEYAAPFLPGGRTRASKIQGFLAWITDGRFVFMGMRRYRLDSVDGEFVVQSVPGTGLGMWHDDASSRFHEPRRGDEIPDEIREDLEDPRIIILSKSRMESRIHRHGRLDRIVVKEHDDQGRITGFAIVTGLFTQRVLRTPGSQIPLLAERLREICDRLEVPQGSHRHKAIVAAFDSAPVELLFSMDVEQIANLLEELVADAGKRSVQIVLRTHPRGRTFYAAVLMPRAHYREGLRSGIRRLLEEETGATYIDDRTSFIDEETAVVHCFCTTAEKLDLAPDEARLEEAMRTLCSPWEDRFLEALRRHYGEDRAPVLAARYETVFPEVLRWQTHPTDAVRDVEAIERLHETGEPQFALYFDEGDPVHETATLRMYLPQAPLLSDLLPTVDRFDLRVVDAQLALVHPVGRGEVAVESLRILPLGTEQADLDAISGRLCAALRATLSGATPSDSLDGLVLGAGFDWRQVDLVRAYLEYFVQIQGTLSRPFLRRVMQENPIAVRLLVRLFEARHDPSLSDEVRNEREERLRSSFQSYRDRISALNEDRALAGLYDLIDATLRTNYFAPASMPHRIVLKLDSSRIAELSGVVPYREIFVHSAQLTGIHLRGGPVARGGLRWSDRHDDLRVEILDLMRTQMLKNGLIVPVGAKGGFVLRATRLSPTEARQKADEQYRVFISSLLDLTDNLAPDGTVIPPKGVRRLDGDDPYLVVAADKGTAHLSDTANEIALERDFWLGDAFASGGSHGYDHKKYGITARGAWECVKHHFAELGIDPERDAYTVAGIGDMSGDVFGNGLLLMRRAKLVAAFDHRHVFLDPEPDAERTWHERKRLFELPRSSWADFSADCLSEGGGVWPRGSKSIPLSAPLRERLGIDQDHASGQQIVSAILRMQVDLLWNGGIGTYVRASHESDAEVGDRSNDAIRITARELRARVVGEGGNLGFTQAGRVEASMSGVRIDTDAIDNSAGVDLSDHEVNYKVALAPLVRAGELSFGERNRILVDSADEACENVLSHNRSQALALSIDELRSASDPEVFLRAIEELCAARRFDPTELELPDAAALADRGPGRGLTRPELAVLLGLAKLHVQAELSGSDLPLRDYVDPVYQHYFPEVFFERFANALESHRLRREIGALCLVNRLVDAGGATLFVALTAELGVGVAEAAAALVMAEDLFGIPELRRRLREVPLAQGNIHALLLELDEGVREVARYLVRSHAGALEREHVESLRDGVDVLRRRLRDYLSGAELQRLEERQARLAQEGVPADVALDIASLPLADRGLNILRVCMETQSEAIDAARVYAKLGDETGINWVYARLAQSKHESLWDRIVLADLRWDLLDLQCAITADVLRRPAASREQAVAGFLAEHAPLLEGVQELERRAATEAGPSALTVIAGRLFNLRAP